jgi:hypothetical protein
MKPISDMVSKFFEDYERGSNVPDPELPATLYVDSFMFASPQGTQAVKRDDLLKVLPKRQEFLKTVGLTSSKIRSLEETRLDDNYVMVKAYWSLRFEQDPVRPIVADISATYILFRQENALRIVFQLDHQDLMKRVQALGLLPAKD